MPIAKKSKYNKKSEKKRPMAHETNPDLQAPDYPEGHVETIDEFIARGGTITIVPPYVPLDAGNQYRGTLVTPKSLVPSAKKKKSPQQKKKDLYHI